MDPISQVTDATTAAPAPPTSEFVLRRVAESFPQFVDDLWGSVPILPLVLAILAVVSRIGYGYHYRKTHGGAKPDATLYWLGWASTAAVALLAIWVLVAFYNADTARTKTGSSDLASLTESNERSWYIFIGSVFALGSVFVTLMYIKDSRSVRWWWAVKLAVLRIAVYAILCFVFLLPARQTWERSEKRSRVIVLIDISPSMTRVSDEITLKGGKKSKTRMDYLIDFLADADVAFLQNIIKTNPVYIYPFGSRLDESPRELTRASAPWTVQDWRDFAMYDFRPFLTKDVSETGLTVLKNTTDPADWNGPKPSVGSDKVEPNNWAEWAAKWSMRAKEWTSERNKAKLEGKPAPATFVKDLSDSDTDILVLNIERLERRIDVAKSIASGTNVPKSVSAAIDRESANMVQGVIVFSDMRSNLASDSEYRELRKLAKDKNIPVFTIAVGEDRQNSSINISDVQADDVMSPDEGGKVSVEADGSNLAGKTVTVKLDLYGPGKDPKTAAADYTLEDSRKDKTKGSATPYTITFMPGDPPHGSVEFEIDPAQFAASTDPKARALVVESVGAAIKKPVLREGKWTVRARIPKDENEVFPDPEHVRDRPGITVTQKKIRVLLITAAPSREFQFVRTFLSREVLENRATVTLLVQNEAGMKGELTPNPTETVILRFPTKLDLSGKVIDPKEKPYNLNEYDLIIAFDPDWTEVSQEQTEALQTWVERQGGGFIFVADRINTWQLARVEPVKPGVDLTPEQKRMRPILDLLPVDPDDAIAIAAKIVPPRTPRRLYMKPMLASDLLKIDDPPVVEKNDGKEPVNDPIAGWERFFTDRDKYVLNKDDTIELKPKRGFYSCYPIRDIKPGAVVLAEFVDEDFERKKSTRPWLVLSKPDAGFRTAFVGSGEVYRMYAYEKDYYERYWAKFMKYMAAKRDVKASRGRVLVTKEVIAGSPIRVQAQILNTSAKPYPKGAIDPKFNIMQVLPNGEKKILPGGPFPLSLAPGDDGYFKGQIPADPKVYPPGDADYYVVVDVPDSTAETLTGKFNVLKSDLEMDVTKPDMVAWLAMASDFDSAFQSRIPEKLKADLAKGLPRDNGVPKLAFKLTDKASLKLIPECFQTKVEPFDNRGPGDDLWDEQIQLFKIGQTDDTFRTESTDPTRQYRYTGRQVWMRDSLGFALRPEDNPRPATPLRQFFNRGPRVFQSAATLSQPRDEDAVALPGTENDEEPKMVTPKKRWPAEMVAVNWVLFTVVFLLCWEWLTRKLLRLA